jgi:predicted ATP-grasp superfamily ATP-dependent carboligase
VNQNDKPRILLTDGHYKHTLGLARHLKSNGWDVWCIGNPHSENRFSRYFKYIPFSQGEIGDDISFLRELLRKNGFQILLPVGASSVNFFSHQRSNFSDLTSIALTEHESILSAFDKLKMTELAKTLGLKIPTTFTASQWKSGDCNFAEDFIIKSRNEFSPGVQTKYFSSRTDGEIFLSSVNDEVTNNLIVQERISGSGEAFFGIYNRGQLLTGYTHKRIREMPLSGGSSTCAEITMCSDTFDYGKSILDSLNWHGAAMVEFKRDIDSKELYLMEINPKFWGSLELGISHGVNFSSAFQCITGQTHSLQKENRILVRFQWPFHGDLNHLKVREIRGAILRDFINLKVKKNIYVSDPWPIILRFVKQLVISSRKFKLIKGIKTFVFRSKRQGAKVAFFRSIEEGLGVPTSRTINHHGEFILGPKISVVGKISLKIRGVASSVNLQSEFNDADFGLNFANYCYIPCQEYYSLSSEDLLAGVRFLKKQVEIGNKTYIHCREGVSRAPYLLASYYVSLGYTINESFNLISQKRSFINPLDIHVQSIESATEMLRKI